MYLAARAGAPRFGQGGCQHQMPGQTVQLGQLLLWWLGQWWWQELQHTCISGQNVTGEQAWPLAHVQPGLCSYASPLRL